MSCRSAIFHPGTFLRRCKVFLYVCYLLGEAGYIYILQELLDPLHAAQDTGIVYFFPIDKAREGDAITERGPTPDSRRMDWRRYYKEAEDREAEDSQAEDSEGEDSEGEDSEEEEDEDIRTKIYSATGLPVRLGDWRHYYSSLTLQRPGNAFVTIGGRTGMRTSISFPGLVLSSPQNC